MSIYKKHKKCAKRYIRFWQLLFVLSYGRFLRTIRVVTCDIDYKVAPGKITHFAANHQTRMDIPAIMSLLPFSHNWRLSPLKFMTANQYYEPLRYKIPMHALGCYPVRDTPTEKGGIDAAIDYANQGYSLFIHPEGKRIKDGKRHPAFRGVSVIHKEIADHADMIIAYIEWEPRKKLLSRPKLYVKLRNCPKKVDLTKPDAIMDAIYSMAPHHVQ